MEYLIILATRSLYHWKSSNIHLNYFYIWFWHHSPHPHWGLRLSFSSPSMYPSPTTFQSKIDIYLLFTMMPRSFRIARTKSVNWKTNSISDNESLGCFERHHPRMDQGESAKYNRLSLFATTTAIKLWHCPANRYKSLNKLLIKFQATLCIFSGNSQPPFQNDPLES